MDEPFRFRQYQPRALEIIDTTLRDGQQTSLLHDHHKYFFTRADKEEITRALIIYGVKFIELFAPLVSPQERDDWKALRAVRDSLITQKGYTFFLAHVRCQPRDVESAIDAGADGLNFYIGPSNESRNFNHGNDLDTIVKQAAALFEEVRRNYPLILGADSHTTHYGWLGAFGAGVGRTEMAAIWATGELGLRVPESMKVIVTGRLGRGITAKDLSLHLIGLLGADGGLYQSIEFHGPAIAALPLHERMVIPNMMAEFGAKNAYLPPDELVFDYWAERRARRLNSAVGSQQSAVSGQQSAVSSQKLKQGRFTPMRTPPTLQRTASMRMTLN